MAESILNLEFKCMGLLCMNFYVGSVINLCETMPLAVPPRSKMAGMDHPVDTGTVTVLFLGFCTHKSGSGQLLTAMTCKGFSEFCKK